MVCLPGVSLHLYLLNSSLLQMSDRRSWQGPDTHTLCR